MTRSFRTPRHPAASFRLLGLAAALVLVAACSKPDAGGAGGARGAGADSAGAGAGGRPLVALIRAADWMGSEWGEDAIKLGLRESDMEDGQDYELKISSAQGDLG